MKKIISFSLLIAAGVLLFIAFTDMTPEPVIMPVSANSLIVAFGDSITYGTGAEKRNSYPSRLGIIMGSRVINAGVPGETIADGLLRLPEVIQQFRPQLVLLSEGGNDLLRRRDKDQIARDLDKMVKYIRAQGVDVVIIGVPAPGLTLSVPEFYRNVAKENDVPYEGKILKKILSDPDLKSDYIHPNSKGYLLMAEKLAELIEKVQGKM